MQRIKHNPTVMALGLILAIAIITGAQLPNEELVENATQEAETQAREEEPPSAASTVVAEVSVDDEIPSIGTSMESISEEPTMVLCANTDTDFLTPFQITGVVATENGVRFTLESSSGVATMLSYDTGATRVLEVLEAVSSIRGSVHDGVVVHARACEDSTWRLVTIDFEDHYYALLSFGLIPTGSDRGEWLTKNWDWTAKNSPDLL